MIWHFSSKLLGTLWLLQRNCIPWHLLVAKTEVDCGKPFPVWAKVGQRCGFCKVLVPSIKAGTGSGVSSNDLGIHCTCASQVGITYIYMNIYIYKYIYIIYFYIICICISIRFEKNSAVMQRSPNFKLTCCRNTTTPARTIVQHKAWHSSSGEGYDTWDCLEMLESSIVWWRWRFGVY